MSPNKIALDKTRIHASSNTGPERAKIIISALL